MPDYLKRLGIGVLCVLPLAACTVDGADPAPPAAVATTLAPPIYQLPADACKALPEPLATRLKVTRAEQENVAVACRFTLGRDKYKSRTLSVTYDRWNGGEQARDLFAGGKARDIRGGGPNATLHGSGDLVEAGPARRGWDFDEGYYTYDTVETAGRTTGNLHGNFRKGNVIVRIDVEGHDLLPPYTGVLHAKPLPDARLRPTLNLVAPALLAAVRLA